MPRGSKRLARASRFLCKASSLALALMSPALAQGVDEEALTSDVSAPAEEPISDPLAEQAGTAAQSREIVVTGTRIRGIAPTGSNVIGLDVEAIEETGLSTTLELMRSIPQISNIGIDESRTNGAQRAIANLTGASGINLRGLGVEATLTLVNGRRPPVGGGEGRFFDSSAIPAIALQRIEVVADGSSAIYGSDAMTGVANLITRRRFDGLEVRGRYGAADSVDLYQAELLGGLDWGSGGLVVAAEYYQRDNLPTGARPELYDDAAAGSFQAFPPNIGPSTGPTSGFVDQNNNGFLDPGEAVGNPVLRQSNWLGVDALPRQERTSAYAHIEQEFGEGFRVYADGFFSRREFRRQATAQTIGGQTVSAANPYNLTGEPVTVNYSFINDLGNSIEEGFSEVWQVALGAEYSFTDNWRMSGLFSYGEDRNFRQRDRLNSGALAAALGSPDLDTAFNPFSNGQNGYPSDAVRQSVLDSIRQKDTIRPAFAFTNAQLQMDGALFRLPGGDVRIAVGGEYQGLARQQIQQIIRPSGNNPPQVVAPELERRVLSAFGELFVPFFGEDNSRPLLRALELSVAVRYDHYRDEQVSPQLSILDSDTVNPKIGVRYRPFEDLTLRGSWGKSFRAPALGDYSLGAPTVIAPSIISSSVASANGLPSLPVYTTVLLQGGHTFGLEPERAETWTAGFDWRPEVVPGLLASVTYYNIKFNNQITAPASTSLLTDPAYVASLASADSYLIPGSGLVIFNPTTEQLQTYLNFGAGFTPIFGPPASILYGAGSAPLPGQTTPVYALVEGITQNAGLLKTDGLDVSLVYATDTRFGSIILGNYFTYILNYKQSLITSAPLEDFLNSVNFPLRFVNRTHVGWARDGLSANLFVNYANGYENRTVTPNADVGSHTTVDLSISYDTEDRPGSSWLRNIGVSLNVQNLFDNDPPYARVVQGVAVQNYDSQNASALGRFVSIQISKRF